jgi:hypothetical protein
MEREINIYMDNFSQDEVKSKSLRRSLSNKSSNSFEEKNSDLLARQVNHLLVCFDIYLESESYYLKDNEYQRLKMFPRAVRYSI